MKHSLLLPALTIGLCCAAATPLASTLQGKAGPKRANPVNLTTYAVNSSNGRFTASRQLPATIKVTYYSEIPKDDGTVARDTLEHNVCKVGYTAGGLMNSITRQAWLGGGLWLRDTTLMAFNDYNLPASLETRSLLKSDPDGPATPSLATLTYSYADGQRYMGFHYQKRTFEPDTTYSEFQRNSIIYTPASGGQGESVTLSEADDYGTRLRTFTTLGTNDQGAPTSVAYAQLSGSDTVAALTIGDIKWGRTATVKRLHELDMNAFNSPFTIDDVPLSLLTDYWKNGDNDLQGFTMSCGGFIGKVDTYTKADTLCVLIDDNDEHDSIEVRLLRDDASGDLTISDNDGYSYRVQAYPADFPDFMTQFLTDVPGNDSHMINLLLPSVMGGRVYSSNLPFTLEYDNAGRLARILYSMGTIDVQSASQSAMSMYVAVECSDYAPYTSVAQLAGDAPWRAVAGSGSIAVSGAGGQQVSVFALSGRLMYNARVADDATISVPAGAYVVKVGPQARKVIVR